MSFEERSRHIPGQDTEFINKGEALKALREKFEKTKGFSPLMAEGIRVAIIAIENM